MKLAKKSWNSVLALGAALFSATAQSQAPTFHEVVEPQVDNGRMAGAAGVMVTANEVLAFPMVGYSNLVTKKPLARDTVYWIASTTKPFIAAAVMMLVDEGKLRLDDPVAKYLPEFAPKALSVVTVRMLLNQTSGLSYYADPAKPTPTDCCSLADEVKRFVSLPLEHEPGRKFAYSNAGSDTAARVVEVVSGKDFEAFLDERLLQPLGMKDTTFFPNEEQLARLATTYWFSPAEQKLVPAPQEVFITAPYGDRKVRHAPGGGLFSTGDDLAKFAQLFLGKGQFQGRRYLSETAVADMTRNQLSPEAFATVPQPPGDDPDVPAGYGLGWGVGATGAYFHPGVASTDIRIDPERGYATVALIQQAGDETLLSVRRQLIDAARRHWDQTMNQSP
jgi:CubicO group peptidase (beta-lactamase class C family)